jgi:farnesyl diphosphate synthase
LTATIENLPLAKHLRESAERVEAALDKWLPASGLAPASLHQAMRYAVMGGGKRIRPYLVYATGEALGVPAARLDGAAAAVELIHAYSLIHDDLPCMDDDDLRRGRPTCHKAFDEATAILAGDALQSLAFLILATDPDMLDEPRRRCQMIETLATAIGSRGMAGGQAMDLEAENHQLDLPQLEDLHIHKTGALILACARLAILNSQDCDSSTAQQLEHFAKCIGLAFQVRDDILDVEGDTDVLGKPQGSDLKHAKSTYPALLGMPRAKQMAQDLLEDALGSLTGMGESAEPLRWMARYIVERSH